MRILSAITLLLLLQGCTTLDVSSDFNPSTNFTSYKTFGFMPGRALIVSSPESISPLLEGRLKDATTATLTAAGYRLSTDPERADFVIAFTLDARENIRVDSYPVAYRGAWGWGSAYYQEVDVYKYTEGTLSVDLFDVKKREPVWHGRATKTITKKIRKNPTEVINATVAAILANFPPGRK